MTCKRAPLCPPDGCERHDCCVDQPSDERHELLSRIVEDRYHRGRLARHLDEAERLTAPSSPGDERQASDAA